MTYLEQLEVFLSSLDSMYVKICQEERVECDKYSDLKKMVDASKAILKPLKHMVGLEFVKYRDVYIRHYEESVAISSTLERELIECEKKKEGLYRQRFDLEWKSKRIMNDKIELMKKVGVLSDIINLYYDFYVDENNNERRDMVVDKMRARFFSNRYANISNFDREDLGVELEGNIMRHQIAEGAMRKASKIISVGFRDRSLYLIVLDLVEKLKTTYILRDSDEYASVETHKYDSKIKCYFLKKDCDIKVARADLLKVFFNHLDRISL